MDRPRYSAILLAAGESRRMGAVNKLTLPVAGVPMLRHIGQTLIAAGIGEIVAVLGYEAETARGLLAGLPVRAIENPHWRDGPMTSVLAGWEALSDPGEAVVMALADQPFLTATDIADLLVAWPALAPGGLLVPTCGGHHGNPVTVAAGCRAAIVERGQTERRAGRTGLGCRRLTDLFPERVHFHETGNARYLGDIDTPADWASARAYLETSPPPTPSLPLAGPPPTPTRPPDP